jgi:membrane AbrB-like protein
MAKTHFMDAMRDTLIALVIGTAGGYLFFLLHTPLPWTLGSLFATAAVALAGGRWFLPKLAWNFARPFVGVLAGSAFTLPVLMSILGWWDVLLALLVYSIIVTIIGWYYFTRLCHFDHVTAFFASAPGGLGELTLLGSTLGGSVRLLVLVHAVRIVVVVFTVPFFVQFVLLPPGVLNGAAAAAAGHVTEAAALDWAILTACGAIGFFIGRPFTALGGVMLVPMLLSAAVHVAGLTSVSPPYWLVAFVQIMIGSISGSRFAGTNLREIRTTAVQALGWIIILLIATLAVAWLCTLFTDFPLAALMLAFSPGGIVEITVMAYAIGFHVAFIVTCQILRATLVLLVTPTLFRLARRAGAIDSRNSDLPD